MTNNHGIKLPSITTITDQLDFNSKQRYNSQSLPSSTSPSQYTNVSRPHTPNQIPQISPRTLPPITSIFNHQPSYAVLQSSPHTSLMAFSVTPTPSPSNSSISLGSSNTKLKLRCECCSCDSTPEWRRGPNGARTLCNACGLYFAKVSKRKGLSYAAEEMKRKKELKDAKRLSSNLNKKPNSGGNFTTATYNPAVVSSPQGYYQQRQYPNQRDQYYQYPQGYYQGY